jgi:hypothetical protein
VGNLLISSETASNCASGLTPSVCSSEYLSAELRHFRRGNVAEWFREIKKIDRLILPVLAELLNTGEFRASESKPPEWILSRLKSACDSAGLKYSYDLSNLEIFHGYRHYSFPDNGERRRLIGTPSCYYGIACANLIGAPHFHDRSDSFNLILAGEGVFTGDKADLDRFGRCYDEQVLQPGVELEVPAGMTHGHLVRGGSALWFFAYQTCGFQPGSACVGDFNRIPDYNVARFGPDYL